MQIHNLKDIPHALHHLALAIACEEAAFESVDREGGGFRFGSVLRLGLVFAVIVVRGSCGSEDGFPEEGAEPGFEGGELVVCEGRKGDGDC